MHAFCAKLWGARDHRDARCRGCLRASAGAGGDDPPKRAASEAGLADDSSDSRKRAAVEGAYGNNYSEADWPQDNIFTQEEDFNYTQDDGDAFGDVDRAASGAISPVLGSSGEVAATAASPALEFRFTSPSAGSLMYDGGDVQGDGSAPDARSVSPTWLSPPAGRSSYEDLPPTQDFGLSPAAYADGAQLEAPMYGGALSPAARAFAPSPTAAAAPPADERNAASSLFTNTLSPFEEPRWPSWPPSASPPPEYAPLQVGDQAAAPPAPPPRSEEEQGDDAPAGAAPLDPRPDTRKPRRPKVSPSVQFMLQDSPASPPRSPNALPSISPPQLTPTEIPPPGWAASRAQRNLEYSMYTFGGFSLQLGHAPVRELGRGSFGVVFEMRDAAKRPYAMKICLANQKAEGGAGLRSSALVEASVGAAVSHPCLVGVSSVMLSTTGRGREVPLIALTMPLAEKTLSVWLSERNALARKFAEERAVRAAGVDSSATVADRAALADVLGHCLVTQQRAAAEMAVDLLRGTSWLTRSGVAHTDIKPANVLLFQRPVEEAGIIGGAFSAKLADFSSCVVAGSAFNFAFTCSRLYEAPESLLAKAGGASGGIPVGVVGAPIRHADPCKLDAWSLGCVLMELFYGVQIYNFNEIDTVLRFSNSWSRYTELHEVFFQGPGGTAHAHLAPLQGVFESSQTVPESEIVYRLARRAHVDRTVMRSLITVYTERQNAILCQIIGSLLVWNPAHRATPQEALRRLLTEGAEAGIVARRDVAEEPSDWRFRALFEMGTKKQVDVLRQATPPGRIASRFFIAVKDLIKSPPLGRGFFNLSLVAISRSGSVPPEPRGEKAVRAPPEGRAAAIRHCAAMLLTYKCMGLSSTPARDTVDALRRRFGAVRENAKTAELSRKYELNTAKLLLDAMVEEIVAATEDPGSLYEYRERVREMILTEETRTFELLGRTPLLAASYVDYSSVGASSASSDTGSDTGEGGML
jgi:serine/threonine protein kinase